MCYNKKINLCLYALLFSLVCVGFNVSAKQKTENNKFIIEYTETNVLKYSFENNIIKDAHVIQYKEGFKIIEPLHMNLNKQNLRYNQIANEFKKLPKALTINIKQIELLDYNNLNDKQWEKTYKIKNFKSYASGLNNKICFYANDHFSTEKSTKKLFPALAHESAHILDETISNQTERFSNSSEWVDIMKNDLAFKKSGKFTEKYKDFGIYCSDYSKSSLSYTEDFAEAITQYVTENEKFIKEYPNRSKKIEQLFY